MEHLNKRAVLHHIKGGNPTVVVVIVLCCQSATICPSRATAALEPVRGRVTGRDDKVVGVGVAESRSGTEWETSGSDLSELINNRETNLYSQWMLEAM
ncbi:hypothetical protein BDV93DRAFT_529535, partial [Ceratobasidium sp. AG-I]